MNPWRFSFVALSWLAGAGAVFAQPAPAHYIVFSAEAGQPLRPMFYRRVELAAAPRSKSDEEVRRAAELVGREGELITFSLLDGDGKAVFRDAVPRSSWLRGEFHGEPQGGTRRSIEGHRFPEASPAFVVRLPVVPKSRLVFDGPTRTEFDLEALSARASSLPLAAMASLPSRVLDKVQTGSPANRVDLLVLGDGYTAAQSSTFTADAANLMTQFFAISPYGEYKNFVNVSSLFIASAQSGADHPPYLASCVADNPACCADPEMQFDPLNGFFVSTALGGRYCSFNIHRLAVVDNSAALAAASAVPDWDRLFVLINDSTYGGSGGSIAVSSTHSLAADVVRHEYGHSFIGLTDEYETPFPAFPVCSDLGGSVPCEANVTNQTSRALIKWAPWISSGTPIPTPEGSPAWSTQVGLFQGARYLPSGMYRHRDAACLMQFLGLPLTDVCGQEYVLRLYRGGWGMPAGGIDPIEPGSESHAPGSSIPASGAVVLSATLLVPTGGPPPAASWWVNGVQVAGATGASYTFTPPGAGTFTVELRVRDATFLVHPAMAGSDLSSSRQWTVVSAGAGTATRFHTLPPCRVLDTRNAVGPWGGPILNGGLARTFTLAGRCGIPATARAVSVNVTIVGSSVPGNLRAYPSDIPKPGTSLLNFRAGQVRANNAVLPVAQDGQAGIVLRPDMGGGSVHVLVDVNGYFAP
jgi:hypothetical protein